MHTEDRLHALDAVRAFALLSGIVLHATMSFMPSLAKAGWPFADVSQSATLEATFFTIHVFRMTLFFVIAGFFAHLMFHRKRQVGFLRDRAKRIAVPLVAGWAVLYPLILLTSLWAVTKLNDGTLPAAPANAAPTGFPLTHLWFLYYLLILYAFILIARAWFARFPNALEQMQARLDKVLRWLVNEHWLVQGTRAPIVLAVPIVVCLYLTPRWVAWTGIPTPDFGLTPQLPAIAGYGTAFAFGWLLHRQVNLLPTFEHRWPIHLILAVAATVISYRLIGSASTTDVAFSASAPDYLKAACAASYFFATWNWVFAIIGIGLRFFSKASNVGRYLADSSYWLYLMHLPLVLALQAAAMQWNLHWSIKFPLIVSVAVGLLLVSYHYFVRNTYIGEVLNGRRYARSTIRQSDKPASPNVPAVSGDVLQSAAELSDVYKRYGNTVALIGLDLQIRRGELLAILGPNGAGKSTAISLLLGLQEPDSGTATLCGDSPHNVEARRNIGVMLQDVTLSPEYRVRDLIELTSSYYPTPLDLNEVLKLSHTESIANRPYGKLSGGQKRLAQFAIAICGRPKLLFLDEPTVGLDIQARETMWATLRQLVNDGCSIVLTTHYLEEAEALADRVAVLAKGQLVALGSVNDVRAIVSVKQISCITTLGMEQIRQWPGVKSVATDRQRTNITASDAESVTRRLLAADAHLKELEVSRAGLAEAFTELTQEAA